MRGGNEEKKRPRSIKLAAAGHEGPQRRLEHGALCNKMKESSLTHGSCRDLVARDSSYFSVDHWTAILAFLDICSYIEYR